MHANYIIMSIFARTPSTPIPNRHQTQINHDFLLSSYSQPSRATTLWIR